ncbi:MAG: Gfo/Idh/MocA family oxidoreductase [Acidobacteriota bacterium]
MPIGPETPMPGAAPPIVVIGAGGIVRDAHLPAYSKAQFPVAGIFDLEVTRSRALADRFQIPKVYVSLQETVREAPPHSIFDLAVPASAMLDILPQLPDGSGVLLQKPMGETLEEAARIRFLCRQKQLTAAVNFQLRFAPPVAMARDLIQQGILGEIYELDIHVTTYTPWRLWSFLETLPRVEILYHSIHYLDLVRSFLGEPKGVYAHTLKHPKCPNLSSARSSIILNYGDTVRANIITNHNHAFGSRHQESYIKWEGSQGAAKATLGVLLDYPKGKPDHFEYCALKDGAEPEWTPLPLKGTWFPDAFAGSMASLMRFMEGSSGALPTGVEDAFKTMALVEACYQSSEGGGTPLPVRAS